MYKTSLAVLTRNQSYFRVNKVTSNTINWLMEIINKRRWWLNVLANPSRSPFFHYWKRESERERDSEREKEIQRENLIQETMSSSSQRNTIPSHPWGTFSLFCLANPNPCLSYSTHVKQMRAQTIISPSHVWRVNCTVGSMSKLFNP